MTRKTPTAAFTRNSAGDADRAELRELKAQAEAFHDRLKAFYARRDDLLTVEEAAVFMQDDVSLCLTMAIGAPHPSEWVDDD